MKKYLSIFLALALALTCALSLAGCAKSKNASFDVVFITDGASVNDKGYNSYTWDGVKSFTEDNEMSCRYYQPSLNEKGELELDAVENYVKLSVDNGAKYVVLQGKEYGILVSTIAKDFADTNFLLLGASVDEPINNVMTVSFDTLQAGFLAGYASVAMGYSNLGYFGSINNEESKNYGAGYIQGAGFAADEINRPTILSYANYDDKNLAYDYTVNIKPVYKKVSESQEKTFKVEVVDGIGSGVYTEGENVTITADAIKDGKVFDHWDKKSNTEGKSDKKVNINSDKKETINLQVGDCDCTLTAVYTDAKTVPVTIQKYATNLSHSFIGEPVETETVYALADSTLDIYASALNIPNTSFTIWQSDEDIIEDVESASTKITVADKPITIQAFYFSTDEPTFSVNVENGTGSGSYSTGDEIRLIADAPKDGYMFYKWENSDNQGLPSGIEIDNEYNYNTSFSMNDRFVSLIKTFYNDGAQVVFAGGNQKSDSVFEATKDYTYQVYAFGSGIDEGRMGNCLASVVTDYKTATYNCLSDYKGGSNYLGSCNNDCLYITGMSTTTDDENYNEGYSNVYSKLSKGEIIVSEADKNDNVAKLNSSKCLTLKYIVK